MKPDDDLDRKVERWLDETARPMPREIYDDVLGHLPSQERARPWDRLRGGRVRPVLGLAVAASLIVVVGYLGRSLPVIQHVVPVGGGSAAPSRSWNPATDFLFGNAAENPSHDHYRNPTVWSYLYGAADDHDPRAYALMPTFDPERNAWWLPGFSEIRGSDGRGGILVTPFRSGNEGIRTAILGWTSPTAGAIHLEGTFDLTQKSCPAPASGVTVSIDSGATTLWTTRIPAAGTQTFGVDTSVPRGTTLYVTVAPGEDSNCDYTSIRLWITGPAP